MNRREFLAISAAGVGYMALGPFPKAAAAEAGEEPFKISLAEWSLNHSLFAKKISNLDFPKIARKEFDIDCVEYVDQFFADKASDTAYLKDLKDRADGEGVRNGLIMLDTNGPLGTADKAVRDAAVEKTFRWIDAAAALGCYAIRVNARGEKDSDALRGYMIESGARLADYAKERGLCVLIENHGQQSSDPVWLTSVMKGVGKPNFGTLPDFGNFPAEINRYDAVEMMMPFAKAVSAKATSFTQDGLVSETDFFRMTRIVRDAGYAGYLGIETGPLNGDEMAAIRVTRDLLLKIREQQKRCKPIFNGRGLEGWTAIEGGEWTVENGVLIGRNGQKWSTDPEKTGSWLRTNAEYGDFRLELQYAINEGGNSGVFFRSGLEKNPAFTGYEMQIVDFHGQEPTKYGAAALYDVVPPEKNLVRPAGEWNTVTLTAKGARATIEMNGEKVLDTEIARSPRGYIGLQNHDAKSEVRYRNIRIETL